VECIGGEVGPSPAYASGRVFVANESVRLAAVELGDNPKVVWEYDEDLPNVSSPVASDELFMAAAGGTVTCLDAWTGAVRWKHEFNKGFFSSPVLVGDRVYMLDRGGLMHVVAAEREFRLLAESDLGEASVCTPAFVGNRIYIRGKENLYCIGQK
jgi:outer membrane protein assembly factor BamB